MFSITLSEQQQKELAKSIVSFLSRYKHISDTYIIVIIKTSLNKIQVLSVCIASLRPRTKYSLSGVG